LLIPFLDIRTSPQDRFCLAFSWIALLSSISLCIAQ
jgi:hypothetical protein